MNTIGKISKFGIRKFALLLARPPVDCSFRLDVLFRVHASIYTYVALTIMANRFPPVTVFAGARRELGTSIIWAYPWELWLLGSSYRWPVRIQDLGLADSCLLPFALVIIGVDWKHLDTASKADSMVHISTTKGKSNGTLHAN